MTTVVDVEQVRRDTTELLAACDRLRAAQAEVAERLGPWVDTGWWRFDGARSPEDWLGVFAQLDPAEARRLAERSRICELLPAVAEAYRAGEISGAHLDALARAVDQRHHERARRDEAALLQAARVEAPPAWARTVDGWRRHCDRDLARRDVETVWNERRFRLRPDLFGGAAINGYLPNDGAAALRAAIVARRNDADPLGGPPRTLAQRDADALVALASGDEPVSVTVVIDHDLARHTPALAPRADAEGLPLSATTIERLACGSSVTTVTRTGRSIIDVTAAAPTISAGIRRALLVRDPVCDFPHCDVIAEHCDIHHLTHRSAGGTHRLDNLVHLCRHHHRFLHEHAWTTTGDPNDGSGVSYHPPPGWDMEWLERAGFAPQRE